MVLLKKIKHFEELKIQAASFLSKKCPVQSRYRQKRVSRKIPHPKISAAPRVMMNRYQPAMAAGWEIVNNEIIRIFQRYRGKKSRVFITAFICEDFQFLLADGSPDNPIAEKHALKRAGVRQNHVVFCVRGNFNTFPGVAGCCPYPGNWVSFYLKSTS